MGARAERAALPDGGDGMSPYLEMCVHVMETAYAVAALYVLGAIGEALMLYSLAITPGFL